MKRLIAGFVLLAATEAPARACTREALRSAVDSSLDAWVQRDLVAFRTAREGLGATLACQTQLLPRDLIRDLHVTAALSAYLPPRDEQAVAASFQAALAADPAYALPEAIAPEGNLLQSLLEQARTTPAVEAAQPLRANGGCVVLVDGWESDIRPPDRPVLLQEMCGDEVGAIALLPSHAELPRWASVEASPDAAVALAEPTSELPVASLEPDTVRRGPALGLAVGGGVAIVAAGGLYLGALESRRTYDGYTSQIAQGELDASQQDAVETALGRTNGLGYGAQAAAVVGLGLLGSAVVVAF